MKALAIISIFVYLTTLLSAQGPATWNQSTAYTHPALVINGTTTYLSLQNVPADTDITNTTYWSTLDSLVPNETPSGSESLSTPDASEVSDLTVPDGASGADDPDLANAGSTDVVLRGISTAGFVSGTSKLAGGFTISGGQMSVLATGKGGKEVLSDGVTYQDTLNNPSINLKNLVSGQSLFTNSDWTTGSHVTELTSSGFFTLYESDDAGLYVTLDAGSYVADVSSSDGDSGGSFVEVYNNYGFFDNNFGSSNLTGISTNGIVNAGTEPGQRMSAAVTIGNTAGTSASTKRIIIMAKYSLGVTTDHLEDPKLEVRNSSGSVIASNDDWSSNAASVKAAITTTGLMNGYRDKDAALILNVSSGSYYVDVYSQDGDSGGALVEVYDLDLLESIYGWNLGN